MSVTITGAPANIVVASIITGGISEAPSDGQTYGRASGAWHVINPQNVTLPTITGPAVEAATLHDANTDTWTGSPTSFLRQWQRGSGSSWANISGATASTYTLVLAEVGYQVRMIKSALNSVGQSLPFSEASPTATVTALASNLLLHFDGVDGSTNIFDSSPNNVGITLVGTAAISTSQSRFGGSSLYLNGASSVRLTSNCDVGAGDFTIEAQIYPSSDFSGVYASILDTRQDPSSNGFLFGGNSTANHLDVYSAGFFGLAGTIVANVWQHVAFVRSAGVVTLYVEGVGGTTVSNSFNFINTVGIIGNTYDGLGLFTGWIDEIRIRKEAVYTANFTPPTAAFAS